MIGDGAATGTRKAAEARGPSGSPPLRWRTAAAPSFSSGANMAKIGPRKARKPKPLPTPWGDPQNAPGALKTAVRAVPSVNRSLL